MKHPNSSCQSRLFSANQIESPSIEVSFLPEEGKKITALLLRHSAIREDDTSERAATRFASMMLALANIASAHLRVAVEGDEYDAAVDFVVEGGIAAAEYENMVIGPVEWIQGRCERNALHDMPQPDSGLPRFPELMKEAQRQKEVEAAIMPMPRARRLFEDGNRKYLKARIAANNPVSPGGVNPTQTPTVDPAQFKRHRKIGDFLVSTREDTLLREVTGYPLFFVRASAGLREKSARAHLGRQLVYAEIDSAACLEVMRKGVTDLGGWNGSGGPKGMPAVRLNLGLSAAPGVLDEVVAADGYVRRIIPGLLWLVETSPGCGLPEIPVQPEAPGLDFRQACRSEITRRISFSDQDVHRLKSLDGLMADWRRFLVEQERHLPGISKATYNLPVALGYGLESLHGHQKPANGSEVMALAKWLVLRMSNRVAAALATGKDSRVERLAAKIAERLAKEGPMKVRELSRCVNGLKAADCRKALHLLAEQGIVGEQDGLWGILGNQSRVIAQKAS